jgi:phosphoadenosine phosphosulfate reductase
MAQQTVKLWRIPPVTIEVTGLHAKAQELDQRLKIISAKYKKIRFATSLAAEDMVLTEAIVSAELPIKIFTLQTGRLHAETIEMTALVEQHYRISIERVQPEASQIEALIARDGLNGFYESEEAKKACCFVRKVAPLSVALGGADAWLTGQRREQAATRGELAFEELDKTRQIAKFNPLFDWSEAEIWSYLQTRNVPLHALHLKGYPSIGCEPCTRAVRENEDVRAGRWWWLQKDSKECGLHVAQAQAEQTQAAKSQTEQRQTEQKLEKTS